MREFKKGDFYNLLKQAIMFYPQNVDNPCKRVNSFVVLENQNQIKKENFGITENYIGKDFFFSRSGKTQIKYPSAFIFEQGFTIADRFKKDIRARKNCVSFEIAVLDQLEEDCVNCKPCQKRTPTEIQIDCEEILNNILDFFYNVACVTIDGETEKIYAHTGILNQMVTATEITGYTISKLETNSLKQKLQESNTTVQGSFYKSYTKANLYGAFQVITICFDQCFDCDFVWEKRDYGQDFLKCC